MRARLAAAWVSSAVCRLAFEELRIQSLSQPLFMRLAMALMGIHRTQALCQTAFAGEEGESKGLLALVSEGACLLDETMSCVKARYGLLSGIADGIYRRRADRRDQVAMRL